MTTLATLLEPTNIRARLATALKGKRLVAATDGLEVQVIAGVRALLGIPVGNLALAGYQKHRKVERARRGTQDAPGTRQVVQLLKHTIKSKQEPTIDVEINGMRQTLLRLTLEAEITIDAVTIVVEAGRIVETVPSRAVASVTLSAGEVVLAKAELQPVDLGNPRELEVVVDLTAGTSAPSAPRRQERSDVL